MNDQASQEHSPEKDVKLKLAGAGYIVGDIAMVGAAVARGEKFMETPISAIAWLAGGLAAVVFGNPGPEMQLKIQANRLQKHLEKKGIPIPSDVRARYELFKDKTVWDHVGEFCYEHPSEMLNTGYAIGAANLLRISLGKPVSNNLWMGTVILAGALIGMFVKEDKEAEKKAEGKGPIGKAVAFVTSRPLSVSAGLYTVNNLFLAGKLAEDFNNRASYVSKPLQPYFLSGAQLLTYLFSNTMLFMSPRDQVDKKTFNPQSLAKLQEAAAEIIAAQPKEVRESLVKDMSEFMSKQAGIMQKPEEIETQMKEELHAVTTKSPAERRFAAREAQRAMAQSANSQTI